MCFLLWVIVMGSLREGATRSIDASPAGRRARRVPTPFPGCSLCHRRLGLFLRRQYAVHSWCDHQTPEQEVWILRNGATRIPGLLLRPPVERFQHPLPASTVLIRQGKLGGVPCRWRWVAFLLRGRGPRLVLPAPFSGQVHQCFPLSLLLALALSGEVFFLYCRTIHTHMKLRVESVNLLLVICRSYDVLLPHCAYNLYMGKLSHGLVPLNYLWLYFICVVNNACHLIHGWVARWPFGWQKNPLCIENLENLENIIMKPAT